jgi:hypothetical protein
MGRVGQRMEEAGVALTVNGLGRAPSMGQLFPAYPGTVDAIIDVTIENTGREQAQYNPLYLKVKDADGFEDNGSLVRDGDDQSVKSGDLARGERVRGTAALEVPAGARGLVTPYRPIVILDGYQPIRVALE